MLVWFSMLMSPGYLSLGMLGPLFGLSVSKSIGLTVVATVTGSIVLRSRPLCARPWAFDKSQLPGLPLASSDPRFAAS
jgi:hypothetical protein